MGKLSVTDARIPIPVDGVSDLPALFGTGLTAVLILASLVLLAVCGA